MLVDLYIGLSIGIANGFFGSCTAVRVSVHSRVRLLGIIFRGWERVAVRLVPLVGPSTVRREVDWAALVAALPE